MRCGRSSRVGGGSSIQGVQALVTCDAAVAVLPQPCSCAGAVCNCSCVSGRRQSSKGRTLSMCQLCLGAPAGAQVAVCSDDNLYLYRATAGRSRRPRNS